MRPNEYGAARLPVPTPMVSGSVSDTSVSAASGGPVLGARYRIEREVGRGGMATVYLARDLPCDT